MVSRILSVAVLASAASFFCERFRSVDWVPRSYIETISGLAIKDFPLFNDSFDKGVTQFQSLINFI